jgi:hypothetical protein
MIVCKIDRTLKFGRLIEGPPKTKGKIRNLEILLGGPKKGMENAILPNKLTPMGKTRNIVCFVIISKTHATNGYIC